MTSAASPGAERRDGRMTLAYIQACRGIAAMLVALFHLGAATAVEKYFGQPIFSHFLRFGSSGVEFFFVLSGFIISFVHSKDLGSPSRLPGYLLKRGIRVYPSYWIVFLAVAAVAIAVPAFREGLPADGGMFVKSLLLVPQDPAVTGGTGAPLIIVAWSMQYELVFYAIFALFILSPVLGAVVLCGLTAWWTASTLGAAMPVFPLHFMKPHFFAVFALGVLASWLTRRRLVTAPLAWLTAGLLIYAGLAAFENSEMIAQNLSRIPPRLDAVSFGYGVASTLMVCGLVALEQRRAIAIPQLLLLMGDASYVLYLLHFPLISAACKVLSRAGTSLAWTSVSFALIFALCCGASVSFHLWIERPARELLRRYFNQGAAHQPGGTPVADDGGGAVR